MEGRECRARSPFHAARATVNVDDSDAGDVEIDDVTTDSAEAAARKKRHSCAQPLEAGSLKGFAPGDNQLKAKVQRVPLSH